MRGRPDSIHEIPSGGGLRTRIQIVEQGVFQMAEELAVFCSRQNCSAAAIPYLERAVEFVASPPRKADLRLALGQLCEHVQDFEAAVFHYDRGCRLPASGDHARYFLPNNLGYSLNQLERYEDSEAYCRRAIEVAPERHNAHKNLGNSLLGQKKLVAGATSLIRASELAPGDPRALWHLEQVLEMYPGILDDSAELLERLEACRTTDRAVNGQARQLH